MQKSAYVQGHDAARDFLAAAGFGLNKQVTDHIGFYLRSLDSKSDNPYRLRQLDKVSNSHADAIIGLLLNRVDTSRTRGKAVRALSEAMLAAHNAYMAAN